MTRIYLTLYLIFASALLALGQSNAKGGRLYMLIDSIGESSMKCLYRYSFHEGDREESGISVLQVSPQLCKFTSEYIYSQDSIGLSLGNRLQTDQKLDEILASRPRGLFDRPRETIFDNYPKGKVTIIEGIMGLDHYITEEERTIPLWEIKADSVQNIMGHDCTLATTNLHGRQWHVWFTNALPMPYGPWLLRGLPGLVVKAYDSEREHEFLLVDITKTRSTIGMPRRKYMEASRQEVMRHVKRHYDNRGAYIQRLHQDNGINGAVPKTPPVSYNPLRKMIDKR